MQLNFDKLPESESRSIEEGKHKLTIVEAKKAKTTQGFYVIQLTHKVDNTEFKINYDNCIVYNPDGKTQDGKACQFGLNKLKKIIDCTGVVPKGNVSVEVICKLLQGKSFMCNLVKNDKGYLVLSSNIGKDFEPTEEELERRNKAIQNPEANDNIFANESVTVEDGSNW